MNLWQFGAECHEPAAGWVLYPIEVWQFGVECHEAVAVGVQSDMNLQRLGC